MVQKSYSIDGRHPPSTDNDELVDWHCGICGDKSGRWATFEEVAAHIRLAHPSGGTAYPVLRHTPQVSEMLQLYAACTNKSVPELETTMSEPEFLSLLGFNAVYVPPAVPSGSAEQDEAHAQPTGVQPITIIGNGNVIGNNNQVSVGKPAPQHQKKTSRPDTERGR